MIDKGMNRLTELKQRLKKWLILPLLGFLIFFLLIILNQTIQLISWGFSIHEILGWMIIVVTAGLFIGFILYPFLSMMTFRSVPDLPEDRTSPEYSLYIESMHRALQENRLVKAAQVAMPGEDKEAELSAAYAVLDKESDVLIKKEASQVFLTTAISQNGSLDGLFVLVSLSRLLWKIIHLYERRPSFRRILSLYSNVAATILIARGIEDADLIEDQLEPLITSLIGGSVMTLVPGAVPMTNLVVSSITEGSINALLTLRSGCIAQRYLASLTVPDKKPLRRNASLEAGIMLSEVLRENSMIVIKAVASATKNAAANITVNRFRRDKPAAE